MDEALRDHVADLLFELGNTPMSKEDCYDTADKINAIFAGLRVKERREDFVAGAAWSDAHPPDDGMSKEETASIDTDEATRRYPDVEVKL